MPVHDTKLAAKDLPLVWTYTLSPTMGKILLVLLTFPRQALIQAVRAHHTISSCPLFPTDVVDSMGSLVFCGKDGPWKIKCITST